MDEQAISDQTASTTQSAGFRSAAVNVVRRVLPVAIVFVSAFGGVLLYSRFFPAPVPLSADELDETINHAMASATPPPPFSSQVYQTILPSIVLIQTHQDNSDEDGQFGLGSGVVVNESGDILTAFHVVEAVTQIDIRFADGSQATAEIIAAEPAIDIAVLHPSQPPEIIVPAVLGNPGAMRIGDEAFAVGNPLGVCGLDECRRDLRLRPFNSHRRG